MGREKKVVVHDKICQLVVPEFSADFERRKCGSSTT